MPTTQSAPRRPLVLTACIVLLTTAALLPASTHQLGVSSTFFPAMLAVVACFDVMSVYFLVGDYRDRGDPRLLMMAWAYAWSLVIMIGYALAFPGAITAEPALSVTTSMAPYLYVIWHGGFPLLLAMAWLPQRGRFTERTSATRRRVVANASIAVAVLSGVVVVCLVAVSAHRLPVLIVGLDTSRMTSLTAPIVLPLVAFALAATVWGTRRRDGPERWASIAILVCLCDLLLTYTAHSRYSLGWYTGRTLTLFSSGVVLVAMLAAFRRVKAEAELNAGTDPLTGLNNRRIAYEALAQLVARSRRSGAALGILSLDLDHFKQINDQYGHETGDTVLTEVAALLTTTCRRGDVVARVGGEEFLMLLPDTDIDGTMRVGEKIRARIEGMNVPVVKEQITASLGGTTLHHDDLTEASALRRVDAALYRAKASGRNQVTMATGSTAGTRPTDEEVIGAFEDAEAADFRPQQHRSSKGE